MREVRKSHAGGLEVSRGRCGSLMREVWKSHAGGVEVSCGRCGSLRSHVRKVWRNVLPHRDDQLPLFCVRAEKGGLQGDHGCAKKVFKGFAFLEFQLARDAKVFLERAVGRARPLTMASRSVVVRPALIAGSWIWLPSCHRHATDQWVRTLNYQRIDKIVDRFLESAVEPEICAAAST